MPTWAWLIISLALSRRVPLDSLGAFQFESVLLLLHGVAVVLNIFSWVPLLFAGRRWWQLDMLRLLNLLNSIIISVAVS
jgi:hypothetical protein